MSRTFIKEWVEKIDENNIITHRIKNNKERIIQTKRRDDTNHNIPDNCVEYYIEDNQGKKFIILVDKNNEEQIHTKIIFDNDNVIKITYLYDDNTNLLLLKTITTSTKLKTYQPSTIYEVYKYSTGCDNPYLHISKYMNHPNTKIIYKYTDDDTNEIITEIMISSKEYCKLIFKSELDYILIYNNEIIKTKVQCEKTYTTNSILLLEVVEFTLNQFTYKIINYKTKNKIKLIIKTNMDNGLTLSERFFYDTKEKEINFYTLFAAIALREKTLNGIKGDNPEKYFFILLRDLEELIKFNFIKELKLN